MWQVVKYDGSCFQTFALIFYSEIRNKQVSRNRECPPETQTYGGSRLAQLIFMILIKARAGRWRISQIEKRV